MTWSRVYIAYFKSKNIIGKHNYQLQIRQQFLSVLNNLGVYTEV